MMTASWLVIGGVASADEPSSDAAVAQIAPQPAAEERFDVDVNNAPARAFFQGLVRDTGHNILVHPDVSGTVSLTLKHVTIVDVLDALRDLYGFDYRRVSTGFMILPATVQTRMFHLNYLDLRRGGVSHTSVSSGQLTQNSNTRYGAGASSSNTVASAAPDSAGAGSDSSSGGTGTSVVTRNKSDFWTEIEANLKSMLGEKPDRSVIINGQSGVIVVRGSPTELRDIADYLHKTEQTVTRQVILEAKIIEVELNDAYQAGINWTAVLHNGKSSYTIGQASPPSGFDSDLLTQHGSPVTVAPGNPISGFINNPLGGALTLAADFADFNTYIDLLQVQGNTRVLSSPRVSTLHNQKAVIKAGTDEFFVTGVSSNTVTGTATSTSRDVELTPFFSGVALDVTPEIGDDGQVILHMHPSISDVTDQTKSITVSGTTDTLPLARSQIRESDSIVRARSGQVIVIGGLMRETRNRQEYKTPGLSAIPGLGALFRSNRNVGKTVELVILVRPIIVEDGDWQNLVNEPNERIDKLAKKAKLD